MSNNFDKSAILESFLDEVTTYLPEIEANLDRLQQRPDEFETIEETYRRAHTIAGSAAMMDFGGLAHVAQGMEDILGDAIDRSAGLDAPTVGLLRRSAGRLKRLTENIRLGGDETPVVREDDADRAASRGAGSAMPAGARAQDGAGSRPGIGAMPAPAGGPFPAGAGPNPAGQGSAAPLQIPDWLAAFAPSMAPQAPSEAQGRPINGVAGPGVPPPPYPGAAPGYGGTGGAPFAPSGFAEGGSISGQRALPETGARPNDPWGQSVTHASPGRMPEFAPQTPAEGSWGRSPSTVGFGVPSAPPYQAEGQTESFEDILRAFQAGGADGVPLDPGPRPAVSGAGQSAAASSWSAASPFDVSDVGTGAMPAVSAVPPSGALSPAPAGAGPAVEELGADAEAVRRHVATLRSVVGELRDAAQTMEDERTELRTFLDGSRDALDRLEDWAGQQMGLDLKQSPDSVRRYLPLSVIWVTTTRLKRLVALLNGSGRTLTATQEQIDEALDHLRATLAGAGGVLGALASVRTPPDSGFTATVAQFSWTPPGPTATPQDVTPQARPEPATLSPGARAELERETREQLRRELEDEVRAEIASEVRRDEEQRLRQELQIQVRRELLSELTPAVAGGAFAASTGPMPVQMPFMGDRPPKAVQVTSEQSPEALEVFREEAQEHLLAITTGIAELEAHPGDFNVLRSIRRAVHTLKGAAGMMGFTAVQHISHASEDLLDRFVDGAQTLSPELVSLLLDTSDTLDQLVRGMLGPDDEAAAQRRLIARYAAVTGGSADIATAPAGAEAVAIDMADAAEEAPRPADDGGDLSVRLQLSKLDDLVNLFGELLVSRSILEERLERLGRMVGDTSVVGERLRDVGSQLETRFEAATLPSGRQGPLQNGGGQQPGHRWGIPGLRGGANRQQQGAFANEFDELELDRYTEFHRLSRGLSEGVADIVTLTHEMEAIVRESQASFARETRLSSDFQDRLLKARLVPLQSLMPRLYRTARTSAAREGKEVEFYAEGADTEVDRKVFEEVTGPLLHLVRNSINHGLESPAAREAAGKPRAGRVTVSASYEGNQVVIAVRDDGAGIDPEAIRQTAVARGWIDAYSHLSEKEAINLIFKQGMSTAKTVTEESGRGVGLDVVRDAVTRLRGTIEVESAVGQGTVFIMKFPISLQIARAVLVKVGSQTFAVPMALVDQIGRLDYYQRSSGPVPAVEMRGEHYTLAHLGQFLGVQHGAVEERSAVLLVNAGKRRVALLADAIVAQQEIVSKPLGPHLRDVPGVAGAAVLGNGQVVLILELHELLARDPRGELALPQPGSRSSASASDATAAQTSMVATAPIPAYPAAHARPQRPAPPVWQPASAAAPAPAGQREFIVARSANAAAKVTLPPASHTGHLLVVDDSPSVRRVVSNMLKSHGWEVQTARDGVEALEAVARSVPAAVLLDIEMPRMDGYELMATIRSQEQYRHLPLIVLTSRAATKHQQRAIQLGADAYVVKPYQDEELLLTIESLVQARQS